MKIYYYFFLFSFFCFSSIAADTNLLGANDYSGLDLDVELDICYEKNITNGIVTLLEAASHIFGCDSKAFIEAKSILKDPQLRIELILAILIASKYPEERNFHDGNALLMNEIKFTGRCDDFVSFQNLINSATLGKKIEETYKIIRGLRKGERRSIISNLLLQNPLIDSNKKFSQEENELITACLLSFLRSCVKS